MVMWYALDWFGVVTLGFSFIVYSFCGGCGLMVSSLVWWACYVCAGGVSVKRES